MAAIQQLFTVDETCAIAKISRAKFYRLRVPVVHVGESTRVTEQTIADICAGKYSAAPERLKQRVAPMKLDAVEPQARQKK